MALRWREFKEKSQVSADIPGKDGPDGPASDRRLFWR
jgi:hypothetical protein